MSWIGVDFDRTLVYNDHFRGLDHVGAPIPAMVEQVRQWLSVGMDVRIFTARVSHDGSPWRMAQAMVGRMAIEQFCREQFGRVLHVTCEKNWDCAQIWDDRAVQVIPNTGVTIQDGLAAQDAANQELRREIEGMKRKIIQLRRDLRTARADVRRT